jgi:prolyl oligopeptidase
MTHGSRIAWSAGIAGVALAAVLSAQVPAPPDTTRTVVAETLHGTTVEDPYRWLEDQDSPETRRWLDAQNAYTDTVLGARPGLDAITRRVAELLKIDTVNAPSERGGRFFLSRRAADQDQAILYVREGLTGRDEVLVDPHPLSLDRTTSVNFLDIADDGSVVAYGVRSGGADEVEVKLLDVTSKRTREGGLPLGRYSGVNLSTDRTRIYYSRQTPAGPRVFEHVIGQDPAGDRVLFGDGYGPEKIIGASLSPDGRWLMATVSHGSAARKTEVYVRDLSAPDRPFVAIVNDLDAAFAPTLVDGHLILRTNWEAPRYRVLLVDLSKPAREEWKEVVPEGEHPISAVSAAGGRLFVTSLENVQARVRVMDLTGRVLAEMRPPALGSMSAPSGRWSSNHAFFVFSSLSQPTTIYHYDVATGGQTEFARLAVPVDSASVEVKQVWYASKDGTKVPMFLAHRKGLVLDGRAPTLLTGYGGFNIAQIPSYSPRAAYWIERGGVYALPNLRGGGEFGEAWHEAGMLERKQTTFDDFIAAAEWLIANKYTAADRLAISGGSNGGLLVGAALTQRPALFRAVVCSVPLLDMVRYHQFLVARYWVPEYGSSEDPTQFRTLLAYSPYHRVVKGEKYPATLFVTGDADTRVAPLHARKMTALLQWASASERPVLLHYDTKAGHSGGLPVTKQIENLAVELHFLATELGMAR